MTVMMPIWAVLLAAAGVCSYISTTVLIRNNPRQRLGWFRRPPVSPKGHLGFLAAAFPLAWLGGSYAAETPLGDWAYLLAAAMVFLPWAVLRLRHNRAIG